MFNVFKWAKHKVVCESRGMSPLIAIAPVYDRLGGSLAAVAVHVHCERCGHEFDMDLQEPEYVD